MLYFWVFETKFLLYCTFNVSVLWSQVLQFLCYHLNRWITCRYCHNLSCNNAAYTLLGLWDYSNYPAPWWEEICLRVSGCVRVCVSCSRLLNLNTIFMTGFVKTEHRQSHNLPLPLSTLSRYLCISPHSSLSSRKSISRSFHSKVHYSLLPAAFSVCYLSHSHYLCLSLQLSSLSSLHWLKSDLMFFLRHFFLSLLPLVSIRLTSSFPGPGTFLAFLFLSLCRQTMQIFCILYYFTLTFPSCYL